MKIFTTLLSIFTCSQAFTPWNNLTVNIAVVEFEPIRDSRFTPDQRILENNKKYIEIIKSTSSTTKLDMIVFPEATLRTTPSTAVEINMDNPCDSTYSQFLKDLSCAARNYETYVIINLVEKSKCEQNSTSHNCKNFGFYFYNTDVIFDRGGNIFGKYRKYNLFGEQDLDRPAIPEEITFETDFGIKFGIFTCFDILFKRPAQDLLKKKLDGVIFPSMWYSELPFLTALQTQQMWAYGHNVTFFGAGANGPVVGSGGSGIYKGSNGTVSQGFLAKGGSKTFIYRSMKGNVPPAPQENVDILAKAMENFTLLSDTGLLEYNSIILDTSTTEHQTEVCHGDQKNHLCCDFTIRLKNRPKMNSAPHYTYLLVAFSGVRSFRGAHNGGLEICAVIACLNSSLSSCGQRFPTYEEIQWPLVFEDITIQANFEKNENKTQFPNSLLSSIRSIEASQTSWIEKEVEANGRKMIRRKFSLLKSQDRVLTFAIYGRDFGRDSSSNFETSGSYSVMVTGFLMGCVLVLSAFVIY